MTRRNLDDNWLLVAASWLCWGCGAAPAAPRCLLYHRNDGGATPRPYYAVRICEGVLPIVLCDSDKPLPQPSCPTPTEAP